MEAKFEKIRGQVNSKQENQILVCIYFFCIGGLYVAKFLITLQYARTLLAIEEVAIPKHNVNRQLRWRLSN